MASYTGIAKTATHTLTAATADVLTFSYNYRFVEIMNRDTTNGIWVRTDTVTAAIGADGAFYIPPSATAVLPNSAAPSEPALGIANVLTVSVFPDAGTPTYVLSGT